MTNNRLDQSVKLLQFEVTYKNNTDFEKQISYWISVFTVKSIVKRVHLEARDRRKIKGAEKLTIKNSSHDHTLLLDAISTKKFQDFIYYSNFNIHNHNST